MVDSTGPGTHKIHECNTIGIVDLQDMEGFDEPGTQNQLYYLQLQNGVYKRKEVISSDDLEIKDEEWFMKIVLKASNIFMNRRNHIVNKIINDGARFVAFIPTKQKSVGIKIVSGEYVLTNLLSGKKKAELKMIDEFNEIGKIFDVSAATLILKLYLEERIDDELIDIMDGLKIRWNADQNNKFCTVVLRGNEVFNSLGEAVQIGPMPRISLNKIILPSNISFCKLLYIGKLLPMELLNKFL